MLQLKQNVQLLTKQPGHQDQLAPEKRTVLREHDSSASNGFRRRVGVVVLNDEETLLGKGVQDGAAVLLRVRPFELKPIIGPLPWICDFGTHRSLMRSNKPFPARTRRQILVERDEETNEPLFARHRTDQLATYATRHIDQIKITDHVKI